MLKHFYILVFFFLVTDTNANNKKNIIINLKNTQNISFEFEQNINEKIVPKINTVIKLSINNMSKFN